MKRIYRALALYFLTLSSLQAMDSSLSQKTKASFIIHAKNHDQDSVFKDTPKELVLEIATLVISPEIINSLSDQKSYQSTQHNSSLCNAAFTSGCLKKLFY